MLFDGDKDNANALHCYVTLTLPVLFITYFQQQEHKTLWSILLALLKTVASRQWLSLVTFLFNLVINITRDIEVQVHYIQKHIFELNFLKLKYPYFSN
jgi:hypothetical protein